MLRCTGIEAEHELAFAGMHQLARPCLDLIDRLPPPQAAALRGALGLSDDAVEDRFLVSLGLLSLLAEFAEQGPFLCLVDDAQWLDRPSAEALAFRGPAPGGRADRTGDRGARGRLAPLRGPRPA